MCLYMYCGQRDAEIALRQARKEQKKKEKEERLRKLKEQKPDDIEEQLQEEEDEEEEDELPPLYIPSPPSPLHCGFYSAPGSFWLSMVQIHTLTDKIQYTGQMHNITY